MASIVEQPDQHGVRSSGGRSRCRVAAAAVALVLVGAVVPASAAAAPTETVTCGEVITHSIVVANDLNSCGFEKPVLTVGADHITIDLNGHSLFGVWGPALSSTGHSFIAIENGALSSNNVALALSGDRHDTVRNVDALVGDLGPAVSLSGGSQNSVLDSTLSAHTPGKALSLHGEIGDVTGGNVTVGGVEIGGGSVGNQVTHSSTLGANIASDNRAFGVAAVPGVIDAGQSRGSGSGSPSQCVLVASPSGSDRAAGSVANPFRTVQKLVDSLSSGQTGCLRAGTYGSSSTRTDFSQPGITITTYPGDATAVVAGWPNITGAGTHITGLKFDLNNAHDSWPALCGLGSREYVTYGLLVDANNVVLEHSEIYVDPSIPTEKRGGAIGVGFNNSVSGVVIRMNRIHDVGFCPVEEHAIYLDKANGTQIYQNWIYNIPAGTGVQVWDGPTNTHIYSNVIDHAADCFDLGGNSADTNNNLIEHNVCSNMVGIVPPPRHNVPYTGPDPGVPIFDFWQNGVGTGNVMQNNLYFCASLTHCSTDTSGATIGGTITGGVVADPLYNNPAAHDYRVAATSPAAGWGLWNGS
jgi:hypothetical protein